MVGQGDPTTVLKILHPSQSSSHVHSPLDRRWNSSVWNQILPPYRSHSFVLVLPLFFFGTVILQLGDMADRMKAL